MDNDAGVGTVRRTSRARKVNPRFANDDTDEQYMKLVGRITASNYTGKEENSTANDCDKKSSRHATNTSTKTVKLHNKKDSTGTLRRHSFNSDDERLSNNFKSSANIIARYRSSTESNESSDFSEDDLNHKNLCEDFNEEISNKDDFPTLKFNASDKESSMTNKSIVDQPDEPSYLSKGIAIEPNKSTVVICSDPALNLSGKKMKIISLHSITNSQKAKVLNNNASTISKSSPMELKIIKKTSIHKNLPSTLHKKSASSLPEKDSTISSDESDEDNIPLTAFMQNELKPKFGGKITKKKKAITKVSKFSKKGGKQNNKLSTDHYDVPLRMLVGKSKKKNNLSKRSKFRDQNFGKNAKVLSIRSKKKLSNKKKSIDVKLHNNELANPLKLVQIRQEMEGEDGYSTIKYREESTSKFESLTSPESELANIVVSVSDAEGKYACLAIEKSGIRSAHERRSKSNLPKIVLQKVSNHDLDSLACQTEEIGERNSHSPMHASDTECNMTKLLEKNTDTFNECGKVEINNQSKIPLLSATESVNDSSINLSTIKVDKDHSDGFNRNYVCKDDKIILNDSYMTKNLSLESSKARMENLPMPEALSENEVKKEHNSSVTLGSADFESKDQNLNKEKGIGDSSLIKSLVDVCKTEVMSSTVPNETGSFNITDDKQNDNLLSTRKYEEKGARYKEESISSSKSDGQRSTNKDFNVSSSNIKSSRSSLEDSHSKEKRLSKGKSEKRSSKERSSKSRHKEHSGSDGKHKSSRDRDKHDKYHREKYKDKYRDRTKEKSRNKDKDHSRSKSKHESRSKREESSKERSSKSSRDKHDGTSSKEYRKEISNKDEKYSDKYHKMEKQEHYSANKIIAPKTENPHNMKDFEEQTKEQKRSTSLVKEERKKIEKYDHIKMEKERKKDDSREKSSTPASEKGKIVIKNERNQASLPGDEVLSQNEANADIKISPDVLLSSINSSSTSDHQIASPTKLVKGLPMKDMFGQALLNVPLPKHSKSPKTLSKDKNVKKMEDSQAMQNIVKPCAVSPLSPVKELKKIKKDVEEFPHRDHGDSLDSSNKIIKFEESPIGRNGESSSSNHDQRNKTGMNDVPFPSKNDVKNDTENLSDHVSVKSESPETDSETKETSSCTNQTRNIQIKHEPRKTTSEELVKAEVIPKVESLNSVIDTKTEVKPELVIEEERIIKHGGIKEETSNYEMTQILVDSENESHNLTFVKNENTDSKSTFVNPDVGDSLCERQSLSLVSGDNINRTAVQTSPSATTHSQLLSPPKIEYFSSLSVESTISSKMAVVQQEQSKPELVNNKVDRDLNAIKSENREGRSDREEGDERPDQLSCGVVERCKEEDSSPKVTEIPGISETKSLVDQEISCLPVKIDIDSIPLPNDMPPIKNTLTPIQQIYNILPALYDIPLPSSIPTQSISKPLATNWDEPKVNDESKNIITNDLAEGTGFSSEDKPGREQNLDLSENEEAKSTEEEGSLEQKATALSSPPQKELTPEEKEKLNSKVVEERMNSFELLEENLYLVEKVRNKRSKEIRRMVCDCSLSKEEIANGEMGCGEDCLNHLLMIECGSRCSLKDRCLNKKFQGRCYADVEVFNADEKGCGVRAQRGISAGTFIMEYVGEVFDSREFRKRRKEYSKGSSSHFYFMALRNDRFIDSTRKGNISRFINHSCSPNAETQKWTVNGDVRIGFFATKDIEAGEEINFDYRLERYGREPQKCFCGTPDCRGWLGEAPDQKTKEEREEDRKRELKDKQRRESKRVLEDEDLEDEIEKLSARGLRNRQDTLNLSRLMVRCEGPNTRLRLLNILTKTGEKTSLRLFLDYHGLTILWSWMIDVSSSSRECASLRLEILKTLECLPITNKTQLVDSKVDVVVERWSKIEPKANNNGPIVCGNRPNTLLPTAKKPVDGSEDSEGEVKESDPSPEDSSSQDSSEITMRELSALAPAAPEQDVSASPPLSGPNLSSSSVSDAAKNDNYSPSALGAVSFGEPPPLGFQTSSSTEPSTVIQDAVTSVTAATFDSSDSSSTAGGGSLCGKSNTVDSVTVPTSSSVSSSTSAAGDTGGEQNQDEGEDVEVHVVRLASKLLSIWSELKEAFKIPKKERIEMMKEHERQLDKEYDNYLKRTMSCFDERDKPTYGRWYGSSPVQERDRKRERSWRRDWHTKRRRESIEEEEPGLSKEERRERFAQQVAKEEEERHKKLQEEMWKLHVERCSLLGHDPYYTPIFDPSGQYFWDPEIQNWQPYINPSPNLPVPAVYGLLGCNPGLNTPLAIPIGSDVPMPSTAFSLPTTPISESGDVINTPERESHGSSSGGELTGVTKASPSYGDLPLTLIPLPGESDNGEDAALQRGNFLQQTMMGVNPSPHELIKTAFPSPYIAAPTMMTIQLPPGWKMARDLGNFVYFFHSKTRHSQWQLPTEDLHEVLLKQYGLASDSESELSESESSCSDSDSEEFSSEEDEADKESADDVVQKSESLNEKMIKRPRGAKRKRSSKLVQERVISPIMFANKEILRQERREAKEKARRDARKERHRVMKAEGNPKGSAGPSSSGGAATEVHIPGLSPPPCDTGEGNPMAPSSFVAPYTRGSSKKKPHLDVPSKKSRRGKLNQVKIKVKGRVKTAMADNSDSARKIKDHFLSRMATYIVSVLNPYRRTDCKEGRITCNQDFKYLARKLTHFVMLKELKQVPSIEELVCSDSVKHKTREFVRKYMAKYGGNFVRDPNDTKEY